jgi:phosphoglycerate dehydrogenase-like enzyme
MRAVRGHFSERRRSSRVPDVRGYGRATRAGAIALTVPRVAILPSDGDDLSQDVAAAGATVADPGDAHAIIWTDPRNPQELGEVLDASPATWVQLPFAGIEPFFAAGVIDEDHTWTCAKGIYGESTAEHALALMLAAARRLPIHLRRRTWKAAGEQRLKGTTVLLVGTGGIGSALTSMLGPLGAKVVAVNRSGRHLEGAAETATTDRLPDLVAGADFVVLALALTDETREMIDDGILHRMRSTAWLVNVARGGLVDTDALVGALSRHDIGGAALDVTDPEPLPNDHPLWGLDNAVITPHVANTWSMALPELRGLVRRNIERFARGEPLEGLVDVALGY